MIRLTFIVPCYKVEKYVEHCLDSLLACGLSPEEYEIICVNDCSPDSTPDILHRYAARYAQIRVIDLAHNVGFGGGRNLAIRAAQGRYVWFVDSDDAVVSTNVVTLLEKAEKGKLDVLAFNFDRLGEEHQLLSECRVFPDSEAQTGVSFVKDVMGDMFYQNIGYVWRFLYRLDYLKEKNLYFPEGVCWEDTVYTPKSMIEAERIASTSSVGYQYYFHQSSVCRVMEKQYPGNLIYEYVFCAGYDLLQYARTISNSILSDGLESFAKRVYLRNNFVLYLLRTTRSERKKFYDNVIHNKSRFNAVRTELQGLPRIVSNPCIGYHIVNIMSVIYKFRKQWRK